MESVSCSPSTRFDDDQTETRPRVKVVLNWFDEIEERIKGAGSR